MKNKKCRNCKQIKELLRIDGLCSDCIKKIMEEMPILIKEKGCDCGHKEIPMKIFKRGKYYFCESCFMKATENNFKH